MAEEGVDLLVIKDLMSHSSLSTTGVYLHHAAKLNREAVEKLPSLDGITGVSKERGKVVYIVPKSSPQKQKEVSSKLLTP